MADVELTPLRLARVELPSFHPEAPGNDTIYGFLVRDGDHCVLMDTGVGVGNPRIDRLYRPDRVELAVALATAGASLRDITAVVNSHLHFDHCGNNSLFPRVPILVQRAELEAARESPYTVRDWVDFPGASYVAIDGSHSISKRLELLPTPGHTPGHQSLLLRRGSHVEIIVAQAAYSSAEFRLFGDPRIEDRASPGYSRLQAYMDSNATGSRESYAASLAALHRMRPERAFFSHDPVVWERGSTRSPRGVRPPR